MYEDWLRMMSPVELRALQTLVDREVVRRTAKMARRTAKMARRCDNARPASTPERTGRGGIYLEVKG
ncbi:MAG: hypothetical protein GX657_17575 [Chloroflexi bacterium]|nr:hypothetical protein [Chloroflexota bacterium]